MKSLTELCQMDYNCKFFTFFPQQPSVILSFTFSSIFVKYFIWARSPLAVSRSPVKKRLVRQKQLFSHLRAMEMCVQQGSYGEKE